MDMLTQIQVHGISTDTVSVSSALLCLNRKDLYAAMLVELPNILRSRAIALPPQRPLPTTSVLPAEAQQCQHTCIGYP